MTNLVARDIERAADAVRTANHSTMRGVLDAPQAAVAVGNLAERVQRLPQVLDYLARSLRRADPAGHYDDRGHHPAHALCSARGHLDDARGLVDLLTDRLNAAHNDLGHLGRRITED